MVVTFVSDTYSTLQVKYYVFMSFFAYGASIGLEIFVRIERIVVVYFRFGLELYYVFFCGEVRCGNKLLCILEEMNSGLCSSIFLN